MKYTPNYNLKKPEPTDNYNVQNDNDNMDIIDAQLKLNAAKIEDMEQEIDHLDLSAENVTLDSPNFAAANVKDGMDELFTNVVNGKNEIAGAINDMNQPASGSDPFSELAQKIRGISSDATATAGDILAGKTAYANGKITGAMPNNGPQNGTITTQGGQIAIQAGYTPGGAIKAQFANLTPPNVRKGVNIGGIIGTYSEGVSPGDTIVANASRTNASSGIGSSTLWIMKEIRVRASGVYRVTFRLRCVDYTSWTASGRIYKNGQPYGTLRQTNSQSYQTYTEDLEFQNGDLCQLYVNIREHRVETDRLSLGILAPEITLD